VLCLVTFSRDHPRARPAAHSANAPGDMGHHTSNETQPLGQDFCGLGLDEDLAAVECNAGAQLPAHIKHGWFLGVRKG
jgi:hypothetical protein